MAFRIDVGQPLINSRSKIKNRGKSILSTTNISASRVIDIYTIFIIIQFLNPSWFVSIFYAIIKTSTDWSKVRVTHYYNYNNNDLNDL